MLYFNFKVNLAVLESVAKVSFSVRPINTVTVSNAKKSKYVCVHMYHLNIQF